MSRELVALIVRHGETPQGAASTSSFTITAGLTVAASTLTVHYQCQP
jgi:hypothetical protein